MSPAFPNNMEIKMRSRARSRKASATPPRKKSGTRGSNVSESPARLEEEPSNELLLQIARQHFRVETLEVRHSDRLDFRDTYVGSMRKALVEAYKAGLAAARR